MLSRKIPRRLRWMSLRKDVGLGAAISTQNSRKYSKAKDNVEVNKMKKSEIIALAFFRSAKIPMNSIKALTLCSNAQLFFLHAACLFYQREGRRR